MPEQTPADDFEVVPGDCSPSLESGDSDAVHADAVHADAVHADDVHADDVHADAVHADDVVSVIDGFAWDAAVAAEVTACDIEARLEVEVELLIAADAAVAAAAAERVRLVDRVRDAAIAAHGIRATPSRRASGGLHAVTPARSREIAERSARAEVAMALGLSDGGAGAVVDAAEALRRRHPAVLDAMRAGAIRERHATRLVRSVAELPADAAARVVTAALLQADRAFAKFGTLVDRLVHREHPQSPESRHARALEDRAAWINADRDGMAMLTQLMPAEHAHAILNRAKSMATVLLRNPDERRTLTQATADVLADLLLDGETASLPEAARGIRPTVFISVPALSLATGDDEHGIAEVDGAGPIDLDTAARLIGAASEWTRIVTHPVSGMILSVDRHRYRPPAGIARLARWNHGTCTFPGCRTAAHRCELDHVVDWNHGGATSLANLQPLCTGHHTVKHATAWNVSADGAGGVTWTSPGGQRSTSPPRAPWRLAPPMPGFGAGAGPGPDLATAEPPPF